MNNTRDEYTCEEAGKILKIQAQSVHKYFKRYQIGEKRHGRVLFTAADIEEIRITDGRRKENK